ncbi:hypothetical protein LCGC14_1065720 [marine sediment metagenome]|uniref:Uncharacterized protein n=1 Tax=marine sediment metagenome TaxID=412755 RepID=A0A0F9Q2Q8_9ZZZZ
MKCPYNIPLEAYYGTLSKMWLIKDAEGKVLFFDLTEAKADYIVTAINSHEKLVELAEDLRSGLKYLRDTKTEPYGFGIDRLEEKLGVLDKL